ncbi:MAG: DUF4139 domain-containing protein, partial [bacterium]|nr:DUF4139 domain-containing protein [bacterium]
MTVMRTGLLLLLAGVSARAADLPVKRVTLYSSGVACYERSGLVEGDATVEMPFKTEQINDILKSLVLIDSGGGRVEPVVYSSQDPVEKALKSFGVDLTQHIDLKDLFLQLRGVPVELLLQDQSAPVSGRIFGTEREKVVEEGSKATHYVFYVNLVCADGIRSFAIRNLRHVRLLDEKLEAELGKALNVLAGTRDVGKKKVMLKFTGDGARKAMAAYVLEAPVWKTSYRLVLDEEGQPLLQGWAMVDNTTDEDWSEVELTLVSGRPISFVQDLYSPLYVPRPEVRPEIYASLRPQKYDGDMLADAEEDGIVDRRMAKGERKARMRSRRPSAPGEGGMERAASLGYVGGAAASPAITAMSAGVASMAQAAEAGELFKYSIQTPVSIGRQKSAMLPIVNQPVKVEKLSIFNQSVQAKYPLNGLHLTNTTALDLMQGPVTVFDDGVYAGDAQLGDMSPEEKRLISYAVDLEREVVVDSESTPQRILSLRIAKGTLMVKNKYVQTMHYRIKNKGDDGRTLLVEHPYRSDWTLVEPKEPFERTGGLYRFKVEAPAGKTTTLTVGEERIIDQAVSIRNAGKDAITFYFRAKVISKKVRDALERVVRMRTAMERDEREATRLRNRLSSIEQEQKRLRENLRAV